MIGTTDRPTQPGWYWYQFKENKEVIHEITQKHAEPNGLFDEVLGHFLWEYVGMDMEWRWNGPLEPPKED